jgi:hypothetical protein
MKTAEEVLVSLVSFFQGLCKKVTDFSVGSTIRGFFEALALEIEELYLYVHETIIKAIATSVYQAFGFTALQATKAYTDVQFNLTFDHPAFVIPKGTLLATKDGIVFEVSQDVEVAAGETSVSVPVVCQYEGSIGNVSAGTITYLRSYVPYVISVTNPKTAEGGFDGETELSKRERFASFVKALGRGTFDAIRYELSLLPEVTYVKIEEQFPGCIYIYLDTVNGEIDSELQEKLEETIESVKAAGIQATPIQIGRINLNVTVNVGIVPNVDTTELASSIQTLVSNYLNSREVGKDFYPQHLAGLILAQHPEIIRTVEVIPDSQYTILSNQVLKSGVVTVNIQTVEDR